MRAGFEKMSCVKKNISDINIRPLCAGDIPALVRMEAEIFSMPWSEAAFADLLTRSYCLYLVAEADGIIAGCAGLANLSGEGSIDKVMVDEKLRGRGIAYALLRELISEGQRQGIQDFTLEVRAGNLAAIRLYEKLGFRSEGVRPRFYEKPVEDAVIMWRRSPSGAGKCPSNYHTAGTDNIVK